MTNLKIVKKKDWPGLRNSDF